MTQPSFPPRLYLPTGSGIEDFTEESWEEVKRDPRGILLMFEPPQKGHKYIMGLDSSEGITGWSRATRASDDKKKDNGAIIIYDVSAMTRLCWKEENGQKVPDIDPHTKRQRVRYLDVQVAEFAAPCDAIEIARIAFILGNIFRSDDEDQCELIWEGYPGCGMLTTQELIRLGYANLWHWEHIADVAEETQALGWRSNFESLKILWYRSRRHLMQENVVIRSKWLREEYASAEVDVRKARAVGSRGSHDDRFMASNLALWAAHKWTYNLESERQELSETPVGDIDYQRRSPVFEGEYESFSEWRKHATDDW